MDEWAVLVAGAYTQSKRNQKRISETENLERPVSVKLEKNILQDRGSGETSV